MNAKINKEEQVLDKNVESRDPTLDDDNKSDSDEYEYEEIEVECEEIVSDAEPVRVTISEVETITPKVENVKQKTLILKSDGTTEKFEKERKKSKVGRMLTNQEELILLPLIQGLLASGSNGSNGSNEICEKSKHENTPLPEREPTTFPKSEDVDDASRDSTTKKGTNILEELLTALNRLQTTIVEEKEVVGDTRKRNTILTLVAWLKRILQTSSNDTSATSNEGQLTDLLPTELLLTKLMPQLSKDNSIQNASTSNDNEPSDGRLLASSKRFSHQRNNRFNTIGVSKEELADARLYLQKKLLSQNLASTATKASAELDKQQNIFEEREDDRRRSLNILQSLKLDQSITDILSNIKSDSNKELITDDTKQESKISSGKKETSKGDHEPSIHCRSKVITRRKSNSIVHPIHGHLGNSDQNPTTDTDEDQPFDAQRKYSNGTAGTSAKSMNKFALRKLKMKRANTIDIPKNNIEDIESDHDKLNRNCNNMKASADNVNHLFRNNHNNEAEKNYLPEFKIKSSHDRKFQEFLNRKNEITHSTWINPNKCLNETTKENSRSNWIRKFGSIKSSFETANANVSSQLIKKNCFTHAPTSPFKPVQNNKPPQVPNGSFLYHNNNQQVMRKVAAIQSNENREPFIKPQLRTHQSLPSYANMQNNWSSELNASNSKLTEWQQNKPSSVDNHISLSSCSPRMISGSYNPLYVPLKNNLQNETEHSPPQAILPNSTAPNEFPSYTYTCTDYTQPTCVSTFGPEKAPIQIKNTILPDTSYLKNQSSKPSPPSLGSAALNMQMKPFDIYSSSEYLSEPANFFRSPQPFSPTYVNNYDSQPESQEYTAKSHIMQYPQTQTATVINKTKRFDRHNSFQNLNSIAPGGIHYTCNDLNNSPFSETSFSHINQTYVPPEKIPQNRISIQENNVVSMDHSPTRHETESSMPIRLRNNTSHYDSHTANQGIQINQLIPKEIIPKLAPIENIKSKVAAPVKLNSYGGQYIQPKVESDFDKSFPKFGKGSTNKNHARSNISNISRGQVNTHYRLSNMDMKRKQSLPAQGSDFFEKVCNQNQSDLPPTHNYLPSGVLKRSKSTHTLALLQQFENKSKSHDIEHKSTLPSYIRKPSTDEKHCSVNKNKIHLDNKTKSVSSQQEALTKREFKEISALSKIITDSSESNRKTISSGQILKGEQSSTNNKTEFEEMFLNAPTMNDVPSPSVEDGHIIYPGQTNQTKNRVQHYAQTLNAILNRKSIILDDDDDDTDSDGNDPTSVKNQILQKSKSGSLLGVPKQFESAIKKSEVEEKQRTVAAYFLANKSPSQNLQRSSSQHSVLSSSSFKSARDNSNATSPHHLDQPKKCAESTEIATTTTTTTTTTNKSAHHLKILRRQQKSTSSTPLVKSQTLPSINLLDESNVDDAFEDLFASFNAKV